MKAITLWQPFASLVACGAKRFETRGWATRYRGPIAIHAGLKDGVDMMSSAQINAVIKAFANTPYAIPHNRTGGGHDYIYPYGAIIATAELVGCYKIGYHAGGRTPPDKISVYAQTENELFFGDWAEGRHAWKLAKVKMLSAPIPAKGKQGLWSWEGEL